MPKPLATLAASLALAAAAIAGTEVANGPEHDGVEAVVCLPADLHVRNTRGTDGLGLCVFATMDMAARWQHIAPLVGVMARMAKEERGGGWPEKVDAIVAKYGGGEPIDLVQYQGKDPAILDLAMRTGRPAGVTYGYGEFYGNQTIAHMVLLVHLDAERAAVIDNNDPGKWTWMSRAEFLRRWVHPHGQGWAYVFLASPPPPQPRN